MINKILPFVNKPVRYINSEWNSIHKTNADIKFCLCFPDLYELAASNLGIEILYHIINNRNDCLAERCYCPDTDMQKLMVKENIPLFSLESQTPLKEFDIIGFSLQYELCYTNVLTMLELANIPLYSKDRIETYYPLIIAGGPVTANPEPISDFIDVFVLGEGEDVINEIIDAVKEMKLMSNIIKSSRELKQGLLLKLAKKQGIYVPQFYDVEYNTNNTIKKIVPKIHNLDTKNLVKRTVDIRSSYFPVKPIVPYMETVHNRFTVEISRGCIHNCRFCQATQICRPWRERTVEQILQIVSEGIKNTGYEEISLLSFSVCDYTEIKRLLMSMSELCYNNDTFISVPSLRYSPEIMDILGYLIKPHRTSLTFAIETASKRLQKVINKEIDLNNIIKTIRIINNSGWELIKLYFMFGLPTETDFDIQEIINFVEIIRKMNINLGLNITISPFVPKPHTPFQFAKQDSDEVLGPKQVMLLKKLKGNVKKHSLQMATIEGILSRGDRRLNSVIYNVWQKGAMFDHWRERFNYELWNNTFNECGIEKEFYLRERDYNEILPWEHLSFGHSKEYLWKEYETALSYKDTDKSYINVITELPNITEKIQEKVYCGTRYVSLKNRTFFRLKFARKNGLRFISHLDQIQLIRRIIRRAKLPVSYSSGFHPQPKISFGPAISVGYESESEYIDIEFFKSVDEKTVAKLIIEQLPESFSLLEVRRIPDYITSLETAINLAKWEVKFNNNTLASLSNSRMIESKLKEFLDKKEVVFEYVKNNEVKKIDIRQLVVDIKYYDNKIELLLRFGPKRNIKPEKIIEFIFGLANEETKLFEVCRKSLYIERPDGSITEL